MYMLDWNPQGWLDESFPVIQSILQQAHKRVTASGAQPTLEELGRHIRLVEAERWRTITEVDTADTAFSIIVPIHNERNFLSSVLGTLSYAFIPHDANATFVFITNGCADKGASQAIVHHFMSTVGDRREGVVGDGGVPLVRCDGKLDRAYYMTQQANHRYIAVNTPTPSKANALEIGNEISLHYDIPIAMCADANTFPEPDAFAHLYREAHRSMVADEDRAVIFSGRYKDHVEQEEEYLGMTPRELLPSYVKQSTVVVIGALMAWDTRWIQDAGFRGTVTEDFTMGVEAVIGGYHVRNIAEAATWRHIPRTIEDRKKQLVRYVHGFLQTASISPTHRELVASSAFFMDGVEKLHDALTEWAAGDQRRETALPYVLESWEEILVHGLEAFHNDPHGMTWEDIQGTK